MCVCARVNQTDRFRLALRIPVLFGRGVHASPDPQVQCQGKTEPQEHLLRVPFPIRLPAIMKAPSTPFIDLALCKSDLFHVSLMEGTHQQDMLLTRGLFSVPRNLHGSQAFVLSFTDVQLEVHVCGYLRCATKSQRMAVCTHYADIPTELRFVFVGEPLSWIVFLRNHCFIHLGGPLFFVRNHSSAGMWLLQNHPHNHPPSSHTPRSSFHEFQADSKPGAVHGLECQAQLRAAGAHQQLPGAGPNLFHEKSGAGGGVGCDWRAP